MTPPLPRAFLDRPLAHRTLHDMAAARPENSRAGAQAAIDAGYGMEIDLQLSADGQAMVFHDYDLGRLTGARGPLRDRTAAELATIRLTGGDEPIPTLVEFLAHVAGRAPLLIELKDQDGAMGPGIGVLEEATAAGLADYDGPVAVMSFNPHSVARMAELCPDVPRGITTCGYNPKDWPLTAETCARLREIPDFDRTGASFISHHHADLDRPRVAELKDAGAAILCWTIRTPAEETAARKVAGNITFEGYRPSFPS